MKENNTIDYRLLEKYFLDECSPSDAFEVEQWLARSDKSEADAEYLKMIFDRIDKSNDAVADRAFEKCAATLSITTSARSPRGGSILPILAVVAMAACFVLGLVMRKDDAKKSDIVFTEIYAHRGSSEKVELPDGSTILLKSGSSLIYPSEFGRTREVFLSGECYASIARNPDSPFIMTTGVMKVRVTGTEFNIKSFPEDSESEVALVEGSVQLEGRSGNAVPLQTISLAPGNVVKVDRKNGETHISEFDVDNYGSEDGRGEVYVFLDRRFCDIVSELSRRMDVNIELNDKALGEKRFYSSFVNGESLEEMLATFNADNSMIIKNEAGTIRIRRRKI